jgi:hypothetical protein
MPLSIFCIKKPFEPRGGQKAFLLEVVPYNILKKKLEKQADMTLL